MLKQLLSLTSIIFVIICLGGIFVQFVPVPSFGALISGIPEFFAIFDNKGILEVESIPEDAAVYINDTFIGQAPVKKELTNGLYEVKAILSGYQTYARRITLEKNATAVVRATLSKEYGSLHIGSTPSNAHVYLDGKRQGQLTPLELQVSPGKYFVRVEKEHFYSYEEEVVVEQGNTFILEADLIRQIGGMVIETQPPGQKRILGVI